MSALHELKTWPPFFADVLSGDKSFEVRRDDRGYREGDRLRLREWTGTGYSGREAERTVVYVLRDAEQFGVRAGYVVIGLAAVPEETL